VQDPHVVGKLHRRIIRPLRNIGLLLRLLQRRCEDRAGHLKAVGCTAGGDRAHLDIVQESSSEYVMAPRTLPAALLHRLDEIAADNDNAAPLRAASSTRGCTTHSQMSVHTRTFQARRVRTQQRKG
jgi:hypothetical protein